MSTVAPQYPFRGGISGWPPTAASAGSSPMFLSAGGAAAAFGSGGGGSSTEGGAHPAAAATSASGGGEWMVVPGDSEAVRRLKHQLALARREAMHRGSEALLLKSQVRPKPGVGDKDIITCPPVECCLNSYGG